MPSGGVWGVLSRIPRICPRRRLGAGGVVGQLHPAGLPSPARVDLGLHDDAAAQALGDRAGLGRGGGHLPPRDGNAELPEDRLRLVLVDLHGGAGMRSSVGGEPYFPPSFRTTHMTGS